MPARALVVVAHPDDCEFRCGGTVAKWTSAGAAVALAVATDGSKGSHDLTVTDTELADLRKAEQLEAARLLRLERVEFLGGVDGELEVTAELVKSLARLVRDVKPELVVTHDPWAPYQRHPDHQATGEIAWKAVLRAHEPRFYRDLAAAGCAPWTTKELWFFAAEAPNHLEDVTATFEVKLAAILCHGSQYETSMHFSRGDDAGAARFVEELRRSAAELGAPAGFHYGEDFRTVSLV